MGFRTSLATLSLMEIANVRGLEGKMGRELLVLVVGGCGRQNGLLEEGEVVVVEVVVVGESGGGG